MKTIFIKRYLLVMLCFLMIQNINGQDKKQTDNKVNKFLNKVDNAIKKLETGNTTPKPNPSTEKNQTSKNVKDFSYVDTSHPANIFKADFIIHPDAKFIDADILYSFNKGAALIKKGSSTALINAKGEFLVPYNTVNFDLPQSISSEENRIINGFFSYTSNSRKGFYNSKGVRLSEPTEDFLLLGNDHLSRRVYEKNVPIRMEMKDYDGITIKMPLSVLKCDFETQLCLEYLFKENKYRLLKFDGNPLNNILYDELGESTSRGFFSDGLARVGKIDQFGVKKYGFIDTKGDLVIDFIYTVKPEEFSDGLAKVIPSSTTDFAYGFIDKKNNLIFKISHDGQTKYGKFERFMNGLAFWGNGVLYKDGSMKTKQEFFEDLGFDISYGQSKPSTEGGGFLMMDNSTHFLSNHYNGIINYRRTSSLIGFIIVDKKEIIPPMFSKLSSFDPYSGLAYAESENGTDEKGYKKYIKGYVNNKGEYVLVLREAGSIW